MRVFVNESFKYNLSDNIFYNISLNETTSNSEISYSIIAVKSILGIIMLIISISATIGNLMVIICTINDRRLRTVIF